MKYVRITTYTQDGKFTGCEHLYLGNDKIDALARFRKDFPLQSGSYTLVAEPYESDENKSHFDVCMRYGCVHYGKGE